MFELRVICPQERVGPITEALQVLGATSVSSSDADAGTQDERALFGEPGLPAVPTSWHRTMLAALFADEAAARHAAQVLPAQDFFRNASVDSVAPVPERDWVRLTQAQFEPVAITPEFWIVPSWHPAPVQATRVIHLDPGLAFGTGTHPTTRMCLKWVAARAPAASRVLDYGCGSGILAIAAALFGARDVDAVDIDPAAITATAANARANGASIHAGPPEDAHGSYAVVVANILAQPLKVLAPLLCTHLASGGALALAGILERQFDELRRAYAPWIALQVADHEQGWVLLTGTKA